TRWPATTPRSPAGSARRTPPPRSARPAPPSPWSARPPWCAGPGRSAAPDGRSDRLRVPRLSAARPASGAGYGMMEDVSSIHTQIRTSPLSVDELLAIVADPAAGGTAVFLGTVRDHTPDAPGAVVTALEYEAHPEAAKLLREVAEKV